MIDLEEREKLRDAVVEAARQLGEAWSRQCDGEACRYEWTVACKAVLGAVDLLKAYEAAEKAREEEDG